MAKSQINQSKAADTPVLRGKTYCSPRCNCGCTLASFRQASSKAKALAKRLGPAWQPEVWENGGWYYSVKAQLGMVTLEVFPSIGKGGAWVSCEFTGPGCSYQVVGEGRSPAAALVSLRKKLALYAEVGLLVSRAAKRGWSQCKTKTK